MRIIDAINQVDIEMPNTYSQSDKVEWLSGLDGMIMKTVISTHEGADDYEFHGYDGSTSMETVLLVGHPYEEIYPLWLESKIHYHNQEYQKYNNAVTRFNDVFQVFEKDYNRNHMPIGRRFKYY